MRALDLRGRRFKRLIAVARNGHVGVKVQWRCLCDCGKTCLALTNDLTSGRHGSCGCLHREIVTKHGHAKKTDGNSTPTYRTWLSMIQRCTNPNATGFEHYGGRGISVCKRWLKFEQFVADVGIRPSLLHSLDRFPDPDGDYRPGNCRWATRKQQRQNLGKPRRKVLPA